MASLTDTQLSAIISAQLRLARDHDRAELAGTRSKAIDYYFGRMDAYVPPEPNRSKVVSRDVADTIGWMMPQLVRVFTSSDRFVEAEPVEEGDIEFAGQATDGMNHVFWKDNPGEEVCYDATHDALLFGDGVVKTYWDDTPQYAVSFHSGLTEDQRAMLLLPNENGEEPEVLAAEERTELVDDGMGNQMPVLVYDCKIRRMKARGRFVIEAIPPEDYLKDRDATSTEDAVMQAHRSEKTRSQLIEMGFDRDLVRSINAASDWDEREEMARDPRSREDAPDDSTELVDLYEVYIKVDVDGDGMAECVRAYYAGGESGTLLDWEVWEDETPFDTIPYEPVPHRFESRSVFDKTADVQDIKTVLHRQVLNNIYAVNNPQRAVIGKVKNPEELLAPSFNGTVFADAGTEIVPLPVPFVANHAFEGLAYQDEVTQRRTGVGRQSMALDPEALQNQSATANQNQKDAAYSQVELAARNMARGWKKVFRKLMRLMIKHQTTPRTIRLRGEEFTTIDPRHWNADMDVTINVGLGTGSRDRDMVMLQQVLANQVMLADRFMASGATEQAIELLPKIIRTMQKIAESAGLRNADEYYPDDVEELVERLKQVAAQAAEQPNPEVMKEQAKAQAQIQIEQARIQAEGQLEQLRLQAGAQAERMKAEGNAVKERAQLEADLQTKEADRQNALMIEQQRQAFERDKFMAELQFKMWEAQQKFALERDKLNTVDVEEEQEGPPGPDGKPKKTKSKVRVVDNSAAVMQGIGKLGEAIAQMSASLTAPTEIVRDQNGRAVGTRKVVN